MIPLSDLCSGDLLTASVSYLKFLSVDIDADQFVAGLPVEDGALSETLLGRAVGRLDMVVQWQSKRKIKPADLPCCAKLKNGSFVILADIEDGVFLVLGQGATEAIRRVSLAQFKSEYAGTIFTVLPSVTRLQKQHSVVDTRGHWFWKRLFTQRIRLLDIVLSSLFANILAVTVSLFALQVYDRVLPGQSEATLWVLAGGAFIAITFEAFLRVSRARLIDTMGKEAEIEITRDIFARFVGMKLGRRPAPPGSLIHMVREFSAVKEFFSTAAVGVVADLPFVFIFLGLIYGIAGNVVWVVVAGALMTILPSLLLRGKMAQLSKETMGGMSSASRLLTEAAYGAETMKLSRGEVFFQRQWEDIVSLNAAKTTEQRTLTAFLTHWATSVQQVTYVSAVIAGVYMVFAKEFTMGAIIAVSILSTRTLSPVTQLSQVLSRWQNMKTALDGLDTVMGAEQERDTARSYLRRPRLQGSLSVQKAKFAHPGSQIVGLNIEALQLEPGARLALLGANGSGKSTLLRLVAGLYDPSEGEMLVDGIDIRQIDPVDLRNNIGYLPQEVRLFRGTLRENLTMDGRAYSDERLLEALTFGGLEEFAKQHPEGLDAKVPDGGDGFSIGQKQSIGLARVFLLDPAIILLDEPTASLDQNLENAVVQRLGNWIGNRTCIVATHRMQILSQMTKVAVLNGGRIMTVGDRDEVLRKITHPRPVNSPNNSKQVVEK